MAFAIRCVCLCTMCVHYVCALCVCTMCVHYVCAVPARASNLLELELPIAEACVGTEPHVCFFLHVCVHVHACVCVSMPGYGCCSQLSSSLSNETGSLGSLELADSTKAGWTVNPRNRTVSTSLDWNYGPQSVMRSDFLTDSEDRHAYLARALLTKQCVPAPAAIFLEPIYTTPEAMSPISTLPGLTRKPPCSLTRKGRKTGNTHCHSFFELIMTNISPIWI